MTRPLPLLLDRRLFASAVALVALGACSERTPDTRTTSTSAGATVAAPAAPATKSVAVAEVQPVTYADAEGAYRAEEWDEAASRFEAYVAAKPTDAHGHYMLGLSAWKGGDLARAERAFDRALELDPSSVKTWLNAARVLLDAGRVPEAIERIDGALERDSASGEALRLLARAQAARGETGAAVETYRRAIALNDRDAWAMNNLGVLHLEHGRPEEALPPLARAVQLRGTAPVFRNNLGMTLERTGHPAAAKAQYEAAVRADSGYAKAAASLERVSALVQPDAEDPIRVEEFAEDFRLQVKMWQDNARTPVERVGDQVEVEPVAVPDTTVEADTAASGEAHDR